eukprot:2649295-Ditylum_brightwellii.AAC.1
MPTAAFHIATLPECQNGLGLYTPTCAAITSFLTPLIRTIQYAIRGIRLQHTTVHLDSHIGNLYDNWRTSDLNIFTTYRCLVLNATKD